jgi:hypothetical protein
MKTLLKIAHMGRFLIADHNGFHKRLLEIILRYLGIIDSPDSIEDYSGKVKQEDRVFKWMRRQKHTKKKAEADRERDTIYMGFLGKVRADLRHFNPVIRDAANHIYNLLDNYGDVIHASYDAETTALDSIITHLRSEDYIEDVNLLGLMPWVDRLDDLNTQFKQYVQETAQEEINKPDITPKESRLQTDQALKKITTRIEALANLHGEEKYLPFAREFNELVEHYNLLVFEHYGRIHIRTDISSAYIAPILPQTFTGKPIFVIPEVMLTKTTDEGISHSVELVFTEDFTVSYKNNVKPGTATLRIQGIGKYKGEIVTTFNIV